MKGIGFILAVVLVPPHLRIADSRVLHGPARHRPGRGRGGVDDGGMVSDRGLGRRDRHQGVFLR